MHEVVVSGHAARAEHPIFERAAQALEVSAALAQRHAARHEEAGRRDAADRERSAAAKARDAARRPRYGGSRSA